MQAFSGCVLSPAPSSVSLISSSAATDLFAVADAIRPLDAENLPQAAVDEDFLAGGNCSSP